MFDKPKHTAPSIFVPAPTEASLSLPPERKARVEELLELSDKEELDVASLSTDEIGDLLDYLRERREHQVFRERIETSFYDYAIQRGRPHRLALYPTGWCNSDVPRLAERRGRIKFFSHSEHVGDETKTNQIVPGCLTGDQTMVVKQLKATIYGSRLKGEDLVRFAGLGFVFVAGMKEQGTFAPHVNVVAVEGEAVGIELTYNLKTLVVVPARQSFRVDVVIPQPAWDLVDFVETLRVDMTVDLCRDVQ